VEDVDVLITDEDADLDVVAHLEEQGVEVIVA
jgi:hypothetical protein